MKIIGPRTDPCGTPQLQSDGAEDAEPTRTVYDRMARYEVIIDNAFIPTPKLLCRRFRRMVWSIVSKACRYVECDYQSRLDPLLVHRIHRSQQGRRSRMMTPVSQLSTVETW